MADLYDDDILAWSGLQADLLRRVAAGEAPNEAPDWPNIVEEIEAVGRSQRHACESALQNAMEHLLMIQAWPNSQAVNGWRREIRAFRIDARRTYAPSMRDKIQFDNIYADALGLARCRSDDSGTPNALPETCPFKLDDLLAHDP